MPYVNKGMRRNTQGPEFAEKTLCYHARSHSSGGLNPRIDAGSK